MGDGKEAKGQGIRARGVGADMERALSRQSFWLFFTFFLMILQGAGGFDDESG
jgi:hypothetical protein